MIENKSGQSVYDIAVEVADEIGDIGLKDSLLQLRDHQSVQVARANAVLSEITSGLPESPNDEFLFDALASRIDSVIQKNLDSDSIWEFLLLCGNHIQSIRQIAADRIARTKLARAGAHAKLANDPKQKDKALVRECWDEWQKIPLDREGKPKYKGNEAFAKDMLKFESLESTQVIARWCRMWEKEHSTQQAQ